MKENERNTLHAHSSYGRKPEKMLLWEPEAPTLKARFAMDLISRWGMVQGKDGEDEDTAGRHHIELMSPDEVINRAVYLADKGIDRIREMDWMIDMPSYEDAAEEVMRKDNE